MKQAKWWGKKRKTRRSGSPKTHPKWRHGERGPAYLLVHNADPPPFRAQGHSPFFLLLPPSFLGLLRICLLLGPERCDSSRDTAQPQHLFIFIPVFSLLHHLLLLLFVSEKAANVVGLKSNDNAVLMCEGVWGKRVAISRAGGQKRT